MLRRIRTSKIKDGERYRIWFYSKQQDLYVWYNDSEEIVAFQLCYGKPCSEYSIYWRADRGFAHLKVDDGKNCRLHGGTPILVADGHFDRDRVFNQFCSLATDIPENIVEFVKSRLLKYPCKK